MLHFRKVCYIIILAFGKTNETKYAPLAHLVEHLTLNQGVQGSIPWWRTHYYLIFIIKRQKILDEQNDSLGVFFMPKVQMQARQRYQQITCQQNNCYLRKINRSKRFLMNWFKDVASEINKISNFLYKNIKFFSGI